MHDFPPAVPRCYSIQDDVFRVFHRSYLYIS